MTDRPIQRKVKHRHLTDRPRQREMKHRHVTDRQMTDRRETDTRQRKTEDAPKELICTYTTNRPHALTWDGNVEVEGEAVLDLLRQERGDVAQVRDPALRHRVLVIPLVTHQLRTRRLLGDGGPDLGPLLLGVLGRHEAHVALLQVRVLEAEESLHGLEVAVGELHQDAPDLAVAGSDDAPAHLLPVHDGGRPGHELQQRQQGQDEDGGHARPWRPQPAGHAPVGGAVEVGGTPGPTTTEGLQVNIVNKFAVECVGRFCVALAVDVIVFAAAALTGFDALASAAVAARLALARVRLAVALGTMLAVGGGVTTDLGRRRVVARSLPPFALPRRGAVWHRTTHRCSRISITTSTTTTLTTSLATAAF